MWQAQQRVAFRLSDALSDGFKLGARAASFCGFSPNSSPTFECGPESCAGMTEWNRLGSGGKAFVDFQNDVTDRDINLAICEGFQSVEHVKRYTTLGMATDQGKISGVIGHALVARCTGRTLASSGTTVFRPPYTPVALGALAGHHRGKDFRPYRLRPATHLLRSKALVLLNLGPWLRAQYFPQPGDRDWLDAVVRR